MKAKTASGLEIQKLLPMSFFSIFTFGKADRAKLSATFREILDAMWLFNDKFDQALSKFNQIDVRQ